MRSSLSEEQVEEIIRSNFEQMAEAMQDGNAAKVASYFTEDAFFKLPGQEPGMGRRKQSATEPGINLLSSVLIYFFGSYTALPVVILK